MNPIAFAMLSQWWVPLLWFMTAPPVTFNPKG